MDGKLDHPEVPQPGPPRFGSVNTKATKRVGARYLGMGAIVHRHHQTPLSRSDPQRTAAVSLPLPALFGCSAAGAGFYLTASANAIKVTREELPLTSNRGAVADRGSRSIRSTRCSEKPPGRFPHQAGIGDFNHEREECVVAPLAGRRRAGRHGRHRQVKPRHQRSSRTISGYTAVAWNGQWLGRGCASDGNCYFGSSDHAAHEGAAGFKYDPRTGRVTLKESDITNLTGDDPYVYPQGKLHSERGGARLVLLDETSFFHESTRRRSTSGRDPRIQGYNLSTGDFAETTA